MFAGVLLWPYSWCGTSHDTLYLINLLHHHYLTSLQYKLGAVNPELFTSSRAEYFDISFLLPSVFPDLSPSCRALTQATHPRTLSTLLLVHHQASTLLDPRLQWYVLCLFVWQEGKECCVFWPLTFQTLQLRGWLETWLTYIISAMIRSMTCRSVVGCTLSCRFSHTVATFNISFKGLLCNFG